MATVTTWTNVAVSIQSVLAAAKTITAITKADPGVATSTAHGYANGDIVLLSVQGMSQLDNRAFRVANQAANTFELESEDTTTYGTFSSGEAQLVTLGTSLTAATNVSASGGDPNFIDVTTIHDNVQKQIPGNASASTFTFECLWDPGDAGLIALKAASDAGGQRVLMFTFSNGKRLVFSGFVSATLLPTGSGGDKVTTSVTVTMFGKPTVYNT